MLKKTSAALRNLKELTKLYLMRQFQKSEVIMRSPQQKRLCYIQMHCRSQNLLEILESTNQTRNKIEQSLPNKRFINLRLSKRKVNACLYVTSARPRSKNVFNLVGTCPKFIQAQAVLTRKSYRSEKKMQKVANS